MTEQPAQSGSQTRKGLLSFARIFTVDSEDEAKVAGPANINGIPATDRKWERIPGNAQRYKVTVNYEGVENDQSPDEGTVSIKQVLREEPIESHPKIDQIKAFYGGTEEDDGSIKFPLKLPDGRSSGGTGLGGKRATKGRNPMYGVKTYARKSAEWTRTYFRKTMPSDLLDKAGATTKRVPGGPTAPVGKLWVYGATEATEKGNAVQVTERATLEDEDIAKAVYAALI